MLDILFYVLNLCDIYWIGVFNIRLSFGNHDIYHKLFHVRKVFDEMFERINQYVLLA